MNAVAEQIVSRGHSKVSIRPVPHIKERVSYEDLEELLTKRVVRLRGWPLPFIPNDGVLRGVDWIGQDYSSDMHKESWRFFTSGQFFQLQALQYDWLDEDSFEPSPSNWRQGSRLRVWEVLFYAVEVYELAARLALTRAADETTSIEFQLNGLKGRRLVVEDRGRVELDDGYICAEDELHFNAMVQRDALLADSRGLAVEHSRKFFLRFGWSADARILREYVDQVLTK